MTATGTPPQALTDCEPVTLTVVIPTFRRDDLLVRAIRSVATEAVDSIEILVVDDTPEGSARHAVESLRDSSIVYVHNVPSSGGRPARVRNLAIQRARGRYLYFLDDDDQVCAGGLTALIAALERHPRRGVAYGTVDCVGPDLDIRSQYRTWFDWAARTSRRLRSTRLLTVALIMFRGTVIINSCCLIRASLAKQLGGYDPTIDVYEDVEFFTRGIRAQGVVFVDVPVLLYSTGAPSIIHNLAKDYTLVARSYAVMHSKYRREHGWLDYRCLQVIGKLLPVKPPRPTTGR